MVVQEKIFNEVDRVVEKHVANLLKTYGLQHSMIGMTTKEYLVVTDALNTEGSDVILSVLDQYGLSMKDAGITELILKACVYCEREFVYKANIVVLEKHSSNIP